MVCAVAGALTLAYCLLTPPRYTSTASILIEAPAGNDSRIATSVSPVYLESLKTYEVLAGSEGLFLQAVNKFHLRGGNSEQTLEALKARILKVNKLRDTKVMQIAVTLKNAADAQAVAQYLAEETVKSSDAIANDSGAGLVEEARRQADLAKAAADEARMAMAKAMAAQPVESLRTGLEAMVELQYRLKRNQAEADTDAAEYESRAMASGRANRDEDLRMGASMRARAARAEKLAGELEGKIASASRLLAERTANLQRFEAALQGAQKTYDAEAKRVLDLKAALGMSGERLRVIDRGAVPERPSEPKTALLVGAAIGLAMLASVVYLSITFGFRA